MGIVEMNTVKLGLVAAVVAACAFAAPASASPLKAGAKAGVDTQLITKVRARFRCVAVGRTINGRRIPGVRGVALGRYARPTCRRALRRCRADLAYRKRRGLNPFGTCRVRRVRPI